MAMMPEPKVYHSMVNCNGKTYVLGGLSRIRAPSKTMFKFDSETNKWFPCANLKFARSNFTALCSGYSSNIYVFGGTEIDEMSRVIEKYDSTLDSW
jgi:hypothetical protein